MYKRLSKASLPLMMSALGVFRNEDNGEHGDVEEEMRHARRIGVAVDGHEEDHNRHDDEKALVMIVLNVERLPKGQRIIFSLSHACLRPGDPCVVVDGQIVQDGVQTVQHGP